ncbi:MAG: Abortive infection protein [Hyphomicrobiales bacterium]|nr:Abortive infection protein [Hyphomicrobiales bacterium]
MSFPHRSWAFVPLSGVAVLLITPALAICLDIIPFDARFEALLVVSAVCIAFCALAGFSFRELGLRRSFVLRHWLGCSALTLLLVASIFVEAQVFANFHRPPDWVSFAPFYVLVSTPCQELVCRSVPKLVTDRLRKSDATYVLYSATIFSLMHLAYADVALLLNTFLLGLVWGTAYAITRNLWPVIASHAVVGMLAFSMGLA